MGEGEGMLGYCSEDRKFSSVQLLKLVHRNEELLLSATPASVELAGQEFLCYHFLISSFGCPFSNSSMLIFL